MRRDYETLTESVARGIGVVLLIALGARFTWMLLEPLLPVLGAILAVLAFAWWLVAGPRYRGD